MSESWRASGFFAVHYDLHATANDTALGANLTHEGLRAEVERLSVDWLQCDAKGHPGYTSYPTKVGSPSPGIITDALRVHRDVTAELAMPLVVHYSGLMDERAIELHPEWAVVNVDGTTDPMKVCTRSDYRAELMIPQLLEIIDDYDVDGIWVDGENWGAAPCWCERCQKEFGAGVPTASADPGWQDWLAFHRAGFVAHVVEYCDAVHSRKSTCEVTSNWMAGLIEPEDVPPAVDWLSGDSAPLVSTVVNSRVVDGRNLPWELMTWGFITPFPGHTIVDLKPAAHLRQEVAISMACGGGAVIYDLPERSGHLTTWRQQALAELGAWCRERQHTVRGTTSVPQVAVLQSDRHHYLHSPPLFAAGEGDQPVVGAVYSLLASQLHVDVINEADLTRRGDGYRLIVVPEQEDLSADAIAALESFTRGGGRVLVTGVRAAAAMPVLVGAEPAGEPVEGYSMLRSGDRSYTVTGPWQPVAPAEAEAVRYLLASREADDATDQVVVTTNDLGTGRVVAAHGPLFAHHAEHPSPYSRDLIAELCALTSPALDLDVRGPHSVHVSMREKDGSTIVHLVNMAGWNPLAGVTTHIDEVPSTGPLTVRVRRVGTKAVSLVPAEQTPLWSTDGEWTTVEVQDVHIHTAVVLT